MAVLGASQMPASQIALPQMSAVDDFQTGRLNAANNQMNDMKSQAAMMELLATGAAYALPQGPNGPVDPARWNEVLDTYEASGMPADKVAAFRAKPELAGVLLQGSAAALKNQSDAASFDRSLKLLDAQIAQAMSATSKNLEVPAPTLTDDQKELGQINTERQAAGVKAMTMEELLASRGAGGNGITITNPDGTTTQIGGKGSASYDVAEGKGLYELGKTIADEGRSGSAAVGRLSKMRDLLENEKVYTGIGSDQVQALQRFGALFGVTEGIQDLETFNSLSKQAALDLMGGSLGSGFSNADRDFVEGQVPTMQNTKAGNLALVGVLTKIAERKKDIAKFAADYKDAHGGKLDYKFDAALAEWAEANPLFGDEGGDNAASPAAEETQTIDGVKYVKRGDKWFTAD
jgi:hypothetical protein